MDGGVSRIQPRPTTQTPVARAQSDSATSGEDFAQLIHPILPEEQRKKGQGQNQPLPLPPPLAQTEEKKSARPAGALYPDETWLEEEPPGAHLDKRA